MVDVRTLLAAVLGVLVGVVCLVAPDAVVRVHTAGRRPHDGRGEYGANGAAPTRWRRVVQALGVGCLAAGCYFGYVALV
ncbi:hypothetical protein [Haloplanus salilacus]|uniref:hypothetical protein n=1 Tax=Haloplanus salilacus TaxID=2949994 RepID=UPI0030CEE4EA